MGGTVGHARYFSRFVALQIKAAVLGTPLPIFESGSESVGAIQRNGNGSSNGAGNTGTGTGNGNGNLEKQKANI